MSLVWMPLVAKLALLLCYRSKMTRIASASSLVALAMLKSRRRPPITAALPVQVTLPRSMEFAQVLLILAVVVVEMVVVVVV